MPLVRVTPPVPITPPAGPPNPAPSPTPIGASVESIPKPLAFMITIGIVGIAAELMANVNPHAAYLFVALVLMGYAATGGRAEKVLEFTTKVSNIAKGQ